MDLNGFEKKMVEEVLNEVECLARKLLGCDVTVTINSKSSSIVVSSDGNETFSLKRDASGGLEIREYKSTIDE